MGKLTTGWRTSVITAGSWSGGGVLEAADGEVGHDVNGLGVRAWSLRGSKWLVDRFTKQRW